MQRWPLKEREPVTHSATARSRSASSSTMAGFLASSPRMHRRRLGMGWQALQAVGHVRAADEGKGGNLADFARSAPPPRVPSPLTILTTPGGKHSAKQARSGAWQRAPKRGSFTTTVLPMARAGIRVVNVSFSG